ncbi:hypothetical protein [Vibrio paucivorans]|uniref:Uncharacterized protein n=1 Tax=Vibrio paucivorans TaxID=2829489 RepID=A0A9X3CIF8_9VIBR|nr:hypothetical protein [Vibrio paucivorans]MCW8336443.1 hypothetical protein [Vibrio paucivorans]
MSKPPKPTQKQKQFTINPKGKGIKRVPEELSTMDIRKRIEEIEEQREWDKEWAS